MWQSSDYRLTKLRDGEIVGTEDWSPKSVYLKCPDGECAIAYSGLAKLGWFRRPMATNFADEDRPDWLAAYNDLSGRFVEGPVSQWLLETLSGGTRTVDESLIYLRQSADQVRAFKWMGTVFCAPCFLSGRPWFVAVQNGKRPQPRFETGAQEITQPWLFLAGDHGAVPPDELERLKRIISRPPRHFEDYFELLADANRAASQRSRLELIGPECQITHFSAGGSFTTRTETWGRRPPVELSAPRALTLGFNALPAMEQLIRDVAVRRSEREARGVRPRALDGQRRPRNVCYRVRTGAGHGWRRLAAPSPSPYPPATPRLLAKRRGVAL